MRIFKEYTGNEGDRYFRIYTDTYNHTFAFFETLMAEIKESFPKIGPEEIEVVQYGGRNCCVFGLEFSLDPNQPVPLGWEKVYEFDPFMGAGPHRQWN